MNETTVTPIPDNIPYPTPLKRAKSTPPFPVGCLPQVLREMVELISETVQVMPEMPASVALSVLSLCLQGKAKGKCKCNVRLGGNCTRGFDRRRASPVF